MEKLAPLLPPLDTSEIMDKPMREYIVAHRKVTQTMWPPKYYERIDTARVMYDNGLCEMTQTKSGELVLLYAIPRRRKATPRTYFRSMFQMNA